MMFAFVVLPVLAPVAVLLVEPDDRRRRVMGGGAMVGALVASVYLAAFLQGPIAATVNGHSLVYDTGVAYGGPLAAVYVLATLAALVSSSHRRIAMFGAANVVVVPILVLVSTRAFTSLWCLWAAVASVVIADHLRRDASARQRPPERTRTRSTTVLSEWLERVHFGAR